MKLPWKHHILLLSLSTIHVQRVVLKWMNEFTHSTSVKVAQSHRLKDHFYLSSLSSCLLTECQMWFAECIPLLVVMCIINTQIRCSFSQMKYTVSLEWSLVDTKCLLRDAADVNKKYTWIDFDLECVKEEEEKSITCTLLSIALLASWDHCSHTRVKVR